METPLNASATSAGALLSGSTFVVPPYQREYAWGEDEVRDFWTDLQKGINDDSYFLGLVILTDEDGRKHVVDGQQRILTLTLLASVLYHEAIRAGRNALADRLKADFLKSIDYETDQIRTRVSLSDDRDNETFQQMLDTSETIVLDGPEDDESLSPKLVAAHGVLRDELQKDLSNDPFKRLGLWADFLTNRVYLAVFVHPDPASAYRVFEVINTRGRELTTADLLKNYVLSQTPPMSRSERYMHWKRISRQLAPGGENALVQFIRHVVSIEAGYVLPRDLYDFLSGRATALGKDRRTPPTIDQLMGLLDKWAPLYVQIIDPTLEGPADPEWLKVFASLNDLGVISVRPMVMAMTGATNATQGMQALLRLVVRRIVVGTLGTGNVERRFSETARKIAKSGDWSEPLQDIADLNPSEDEFVSQVQKRSLNKGTLAFLKRSIIQGTITPEPVGVLHLIRPRYAYDWEGFDDEDFTYWGSTIGNTFLATVERRASGSSTWEGFRTLMLTNAVPNEPLVTMGTDDSWTAESVQSFGIYLASAAGYVWYEGE